MRYIYLIFSLMILVSCQDNDSPPSAAAAEPAESTTPSQKSTVVQVFKSDGVVNCNSTKSNLTSMSSELITAGVKVFCSQKGVNTLIQSTACGILKGSVNIYEINKESLLTAISLGFKSTTKLTGTSDNKCIRFPLPKPLPTTIEYEKVFKRDVVAQCEGSPVAPEVMAKELMLSGINVACAQKSNDGAIHTAQCGGLSGDINVFKINKVDVVKAQISGFHPVSELPNYSDTECNKGLTKVFKRYSYLQCGDSSNSGLPIPVPLPGSKVVIGQKWGVVGKKCRFAGTGCYTIYGWINKPVKIIPGPVGTSATIQEMELELTSAGVPVKCTQSSSLGKMFPMVCGRNISGINIFEIKKSDADNAHALGFKNVNTVPEYIDSICIPKK